ncbi:hypothetical protein ACFLTH_15610 [Bacteroidota bacterium]
MKLKFNKTVIIALLLILTIIIFVEPLGFGPGVTIGNGGSVQDVSQIGKIGGITCEWNYTADVVNTTITWYNGSNVFANKTITSYVYEDTVSASDLGVGDNWNCTVKITNSTDISIVQSAIIEIIYDPGVYINTTNPSSYINQTQTVYEDTPYTIIWNTTLPDVQGFYSELGIGSDACTGGESTSRGLRYCEFNTSYLGSDLNTSGTTNITFQYKNPDYFPYNDIVFTIMPVNDAPTTDASDTSLNQGEAQNITITISDEEGNFPINFSVTGIPDFCTNSSTSNSIIFECDVGQGQTADNYTINFSLVDNPPSNGFGLIPQEVNVSFTVEVVEINHQPNLTNYTNFNSSQGSYYNITFEATDRFDNNSLTFSILSSCNLTNPWTGVVTTNFSYNDGDVVTNGTGYWNGTLTNDHIVCRNVTLVVEDGGGLNDSANILLNLSNINDPPRIENYSDYSVNNENNYYTFNLTAYVLAPFTYQLNVTDPDLSVEYNAALDSFQEALTFNTNTSWLLPYLNTTTGLINISTAGTNRTPQNYSIEINVTDSGNPQYTNTTILNIELLNNSAPVFNQTLNFSCSEYDSINNATSCWINISQYVSDPDVTVGDNISSYSDDAGVYNIDNNGIINFNATQSNVGFHNDTITVTDSRGATTNEPIYLYIRNTNNRPDISNIDEREASGTVLRWNNSDNNLISITVSDLDLSLTGTNTSDLDYAYERLNFTWSDNSTDNLGAYISIRPNLTSSSSNIYLVVNTTITNSSGALLLPGTYSINVSVQDNYLNHTGKSTNDSDVYPYTFTVHGNLSAPVIDDATPASPLNTTEATTVTFSVNVSDPDGNITGATFNWYYDGIKLNSTTNINYDSTNIMASNNQSLNFSFGYFGAIERNTTENHTLIVEVIDAVSDALSDTFTWNINVSDVNRPIVFNTSKPIDNITFTDSRAVDETDLWSAYINTGFYDPDFDLDSDGSIEYAEKNFTVTYNVSNGCTGYATFDVSDPYYEEQDGGTGEWWVTGHGFSATAIANGSCTVTFTASDGEYSAISNNVLINITKSSVTTNTVNDVNQQTSSTRTVTEVVQVPMPEEVEKPIPIDIILPDMVTVYENNTINIPLTITNTWTQPVEGVRLYYEIGNSTYNYSVTFRRSSFYAIQPGEKIKTLMTVTGYRVGGVYEIIVYANVTEPPYLDSAKIYLNSIEQSSTGAQVKTLIRFARDLLHKNKECQELGEILDEADNLQKEGKLLEALELVDSIINGCKYLISQEQLIEVPKRFREVHIPLKREHLIYLLIATTLGFGIFGTVQFFKKRE